ncbi:hypothetical protein [Kitasatospora cinereorecta]|uniref:DUF1772 domain-containing protein n=1 Tax=Kitasatospora cinereorecta TaxID=285560 RepID=A0ABW0V9W6_9ACTN
MPLAVSGVGLWLLRLLTAAGLAVDAYVHADLAGRYDLVGGDISQGTLFRLEAAVASFAALLILLIANRITWAIAFLVAASALGAILLYFYVDVGRIGPLPNMYEPLWYSQKTTATVAEGVAAAAALTGLVVTWQAPRHRRKPSESP